MAVYTQKRCLVAKISTLHRSESDAGDVCRFFDQLVGKYDDELRRYLLKMLGNQEDAKEVAQEAYIKLYRLKNPKDIKYPKTLLFKVASNLAIDRMQQKCRIYEQNCHEFDQEVDYSANTEQQVASMEALQYIAQIVQEMPKKRRQVLVMKKFSELTTREISCQLGITRSTVEQHITKALKYCRDRLKAKGLDGLDGQ